MSIYAPFCAPSQGEHEGPWFSVECRRIYGPGESYSAGSGLLVSTRDEHRARSLFAGLVASDRYARTVELALEGQLIESATVPA